MFCPWRMLFFLRVRAVRAGKNGVFFVVRAVSAGGRAFSQEAAGVTPWGGSPTNSKKRIKLKEL